MNDEQQQQRNAELEIATTLMDIASCSSSSPAASPQRTRIEKDTKRLLVGSSDSSSSYHSHPQQQQPHPPTSVRATLLQELYSSLGGGAGVLLLPTPPTTTGTSAIATRGTFCTTRDGMVGVVTSSTDAASNSTLTVPSSSSPSPFLAAAPFIGSQPVATPHDDASVQLPPAACLGTHATATIGVGNDREVFAAAARAVRDALDQCPELVGLCTNTNKNNTTEAIARGSPNPQHHHHQYAIQLQIGLPPPPSQYGTLTTATTTDERVGLLSTIDILRLKQLLPVGIPVVDPIQVQAGGLLVPASVSTSSSSSSVAAPTVVVVVCLSVHKTEIPVTMTTTNHGPLSTSVSMPMVPRPEDYGIIPNLFPKHHPSTTGSREESYDHTAILVPGSTGPVLFGQQPNNMEESHHHHTSILVPGSTGPVFFGKSDNTPAPQNSSSLPLFGPVVSHGFGNPTDFLRESSSSMREKCSAVPQQQVKQQQRQHTMHTSFNAAAAAAASNSIMMMRMAPKRTNSMQLLAHISTAMMNPHEQQQQDHLLKLRQEQLHGTTKHGYDATVISDEGEVDRDAISSSATAANNSNDARYTFKKLPPGRTIKNNMRLFVRHSYRDYSLEVPTAEELAMTSPQAPERTPNAAFPLKLHEILSQIERDGFDCIIGWLPHGRSFKIHKQEEFVRTILPKYFVMTKKSSFLRQLNLYGFNRMSGGAYYHERFLRGLKMLSRRMQRQKVNGNGIRAAGNPDEEPILSRFPSCPPVAGVSATTTTEPIRCVAMIKVLKSRRLKDVEAAKDCTEDSPSSSKISIESVVRSGNSSSSCKNGPQEIFPLKLQRILDKLESDGITDVLSWQPHGRAFRVRDSDRFVNEILPLYFNQTKYSSFQRQCHMYHLTRITQAGPDKGAYFNVNFQRGRPELSLTMQRTRVNGKGTRRPGNPEREPDFRTLMPLPTIPLGTRIDIPLDVVGSGMDL